MSSDASDVIVSKVNKVIEQYKQKCTKLSDENAKLKQTIADLRSTNSRVRRIPKKKATAEEGAPTEPPTASA